MICPICKYSDEERSYKLEAAKIKRNMPKYMRDKISKAVKEIYCFEDDSEYLYNLMYAIRHFGYEASEKAIDDYFYYGYHRQGKGLAYLIGMIRRAGKGIESQKRYENTLQAIPPEAKEK